MNEMYCTQCGHDPLLQADNDRRNREELEAAKAGIEYIRAMNLTLSNHLGEARAEIKRLTEQMDKLAHLANEKNAAIISEMYIADWDAIRAETAQARTQLAVANARIAELEAARRWVPVGERLPKADTVVIAYDHKKEQVGEAFIGSDGDWYWNTWHAARIMTVTHWQEKTLPAAPEVEK